MKDFKIWLRAEWDRVAAVIFIGTGAVLVIVGYLGAKGTPYAVEALSYIASGGIWGIFCLGLGVGLLLSGDLHDEWRKLDRIESAIRGNPLPDAEATLDLRRREDSAKRTPPSGPSGTQENDASGEGRRPVTAAVPFRQASSPIRAMAPTAISFGWCRRGLTLKLVAVLAAVAPLTVMGTGWGIAKHTADFDTGVRGAVLGSFGLILGLGSLALHTLGLRSRVMSRLRLMLAHHAMPDTDDATGAEDRPEGFSVLAGGAGPSEERYLAVPGLGRYHRPGCAALVGLETESVARSELGASPLRPCGLCGA